MKPDTLLTIAGRDPEANFGIVNPPVYHASTVLYPTLEALDNAWRNRRPDKVYYGRYGTPTTFALEAAVAALEGGWQSIAVGSGMAAVTASLLAFVKAGDHVLMVDNVYSPSRRVCDQLLGRFGVATTFYDPTIGDRIAELIRPNTRVVFLESPGSLTFEVQDAPAIIAAAKRKGAAVVVDNSWSAGVYFKPLALGADVSIQAATKYIGGHSDLMMGIVTTTEAAYQPLRQTITDLGCPSGPDDCYLALRGLRTLGVRLARHWETGIKLAEWLKSRREVVRVRHPALPDHPGHALWKRDFTGASGLFSFEIPAAPRAALAAMVDHMNLFGMGYSWGGFESLILPSDPGPIRTATTWAGDTILIRLHAGLEDPDDLIADLEAGFGRLNAAMSAER
ncbi:MAG TPA: cystathionine beta-lyase [Alphaproteobacteria bacterium]|nr:cystathionine beta-lyase [Alphaproteobacteria bacterium]